MVAEKMLLLCQFGSFVQRVYSLRKSLIGSQQNVASCRSSIFAYAKSYFMFNKILTIMILRLVTLVLTLALASN